MLHSNVRSRYEADIYLPSGLKRLNLPQNTIVEIKSRFRETDLKSLIFRMRFAFPNAFIALVSDDIIELSQEALISYGGNIKIFEGEFFARYRELAKAEFLFYQQSIGKGPAPSLETAQFLTVPERFTEPLNQKDFDDYQLRVQANIRQAANQKDLALLFGNGISISVGSRSWSTLNKELCYLFGNFLSFPSLTRDIIGTTSYSDSLLAHYTCMRSLARSNYYDVIYKTLYGSLFSGSVSPSSLMFGAAALAGKYHPEILTFNYDNLLEKELPSHGVPFPTSIWDPKIVPHHYPKDSVFHIHGFLDSNRAIITRAMEDSLILDEWDYVNLYGGTGDWRKRKLDNAIQNQTCFLIGLSLSDTFLRTCFRRSQRKSHYAFFCNQGLPKYPDLFILTSIFVDMNVDVLWFDSYSDISTFLQTL